MEPRPTNRTHEDGQAGWRKISAGWGSIPSGISIRVVGSRMIRWKLTMLTNQLTAGRKRKDKEPEIQDGTVLRAWV